MGMLPVPSDFSTGLTLDNSLLRSDVASGQVAPVGEVLSLVAMVQSAYVMTTIATRSMDRIEDCRRVWAGTAAVLSEVLKVWDDVQCDDPNIQWMLGKIQHFLELARDRVSIYEVTASQRLRHAKTRDANFETTYQQRHHLESGGASSPCSPAHVYQLGRF